MSVDGNGEGDQVAEDIEDIEDSAVDSAEQEEDEEDEEGDEEDEEEDGNRASEKEGTNGDDKTLATKRSEYVLECTWALAAL